MNESKIVKRIHKLVLQNDKFDVAIDATLGNGYDTLYLSQFFKKVIGIDIQPLSIKRSLEKVKDIPNIQIYLDDFNNIIKYEYANLIVFNLGFLPGSNRKIKTQNYTSEKAILNAYSILDGTMLIACYVQHEGGYDEFLKICNELSINKISFDLEDDFENKEKLIIVKKRLD